MAFNMPNTLSAGRLTVIQGIVLTPHDEANRGWHLAGEGLPAALLDVVTLFGWGTATHCHFFEMHPCWCLPKKAQTPPSGNDQLERLADILHEAIPLYKEWNKFSSHLQQADIHLPGFLFATIRSTLKNRPE